MPLDEWNSIAVLVYYNYYCYNYIYYIVMFSSCNSGRNLTIYSTAVLLGSGLDPENNYSTQMWGYSILMFLSYFGSVLSSLLALELVVDVEIFRRRGQDNGALLPNFCITRQLLLSSLLLLYSYSESLFTNDNRSHSASWETVRTMISYYISIKYYAQYNDIGESRVSI